MRALTNDKIINLKHFIHYNSNDNLISMMFPQQRQSLFRHRLTLQKFYSSVPNKDLSRENDIKMSANTLPAHFIYI